MATLEGELYGIVPHCNPSPPSFPLPKACLSQAPAPKSLGISQPTANSSMYKTHLNTLYFFLQLVFPRIKLEKFLSVMKRLPGKVW